MADCCDKSPLLSDIAVVFLFLGLLFAPILDYAFGGGFSLMSTSSPRFF